MKLLEENGGGSVTTLFGHIAMDDFVNNIFTIESGVEGRWSCQVARGRRMEESRGRLRPLLITFLQCISMRVAMLVELALAEGTKDFALIACFLLYCVR